MSLFFLDGLFEYVVEISWGIVFGRICVLVVGVWIFQIVRELLGLEFFIELLYILIVYWEVVDFDLDVLFVVKGFLVFVDYGLLYIYGIFLIEYFG